jgi:hypothetical protein
MLTRGCIEPCQEIFCADRKNLHWRRYWLYALIRPYAHVWRLLRSYSDKVRNQHNANDQRRGVLFENRMVECGVRRRTAGVNGSTPTILDRNDRGDPVASASGNSTGTVSDLFRKDNADD